MGKQYSFSILSLMDIWMIVTLELQENGKAILILLVCGRHFYWYITERRIWLIWICECPALADNMNIFNLHSPVVVALHACQVQLVLLNTSAILRGMCIVFHGFSISQVTNKVEYLFIYSQKKTHSGSPWKPSWFSIIYFPKFWLEVFLKL